MREEVGYEDAPASIKKKFYVLEFHPFCLFMTEDGLLSGSPSFQDTLEFSSKCGFIQIDR